MIDAIHLKHYVIEPTLKDISLWTPWATNLLLGTACVESDCGRWLIQREGPALGIFQMEPETYQDCWVNYLVHRLALANRVLQTVGACWPDIPGPRAMIGNLNFACAMARIKYLRDPEPIPQALPEQAQYWKRVYNTDMGAGHPAEYIRKWDQFVGRGN